MLFRSIAADKIKCIVHCTKGTYIRTLAEDIGEAIGCGAHVIELHRPQVDLFPSDKMVTMEQLESLEQARDFETLNKLLLPMDLAVSSWPKLDVPTTYYIYLKQGQAIRIPGAPTDGFMRLYFEDKFVGIGEVLEDGRVSPKRLIAC